MENGGNVEVELLINIPPSRIQRTKEDFEDDGYKVKVVQEDSGRWALAAAKLKSSPPPEHT